MKFLIQETIVGTKPCDIIAEIISRLSSIEDTSQLCQQLDDTHLVQTRDDVSIIIFLY